jgi:hypothetical protein
VTEILLDSTTTGSSPGSTPSSSTPSR